jgi:hypothetical protein
MLSGRSMQGTLGKRCSIGSSTSSYGEVAGTLESIKSIALKARRAPSFNTRAAKRAQLRSMAITKRQDPINASSRPLVRKLLNTNCNVRPLLRHELRTWDEEEDTLSYTQTIALGGAKKGDKFSIYEAT